MADGSLIAQCERCGVPCQVAGPGQHDARLLRFSTTPKGFCGDCAVTQWLKTMPPICDMLADEGKVAMLLDPRLQQQFAAMMASGQADLQPEGINWQHVVQAWDKPFPRGALRRQA